jgi:pantoate--beta-alanine ligase
MVTVINTLTDLKRHRIQQKNEIGFVPTMGNLHDGHISLLNEALSEFKSVYFSIFVNPKQFGPQEDYNRYPRTLEEDIRLIEKALGNFTDREVTIFAPLNPQEVFPQDDNFKVSVMNLSNILEGEIRPGHFDGVTTVVYRLFDFIKPHKAYFGLKDFQQYVIIKKMVSDLFLPIEVCGLPIIREKNGLALSSRNQYLNSEQRQHSLTLFTSLQKIATIISGQKKNIELARTEINNLLKDPNWNYFEIRDAQSLENDISRSSQIVLLGVYQLGSTRLLDNLLLEIK